MHVLDWLESQFLPTIREFVAPLNFVIESSDGVDGVECLSELRGIAAANSLDDKRESPIAFTNRVDCQRGKVMALLRRLAIALFGHYASSARVRGGSGHFNEQCHPGTYN
jgi:hypothetical protein